MKLLRTVLAVTGIFALSAGLSFAQPKGAAPAPAAQKGAPATPPAAAKGKAPAAAAGPVDMANLGQLMKGIIYPASNVIFAAQGTNPNDVKPDKDASTATNPLASAYGKWEAVENAGLALLEGSRLLLVQGRKCANGRPVPMANADWPKFVAGLKDAGSKVYAAAKTKDQDKILDVADLMTTACSNCHEKYRETPTLADRCK